MPPTDRPRAAKVLAATRVVAQETGVSVARIAFARILTRPFVTSVIIGAKSVEQLTDYLAASDTRLSPEPVKALDEAGALPVEYPGGAAGSMQAPGLAFSGWRAVHASRWSGV